MRRGYTLSGWTASKLRMRCPARTPRSAAGAAWRDFTSRESLTAAPVCCSDWILMKALACEDGGGEPSPPFASPPTGGLHYAPASNRPPTSDSTPAWTCTPGPLPLRPRPRRTDPPQPQPHRRARTLPQSRALLPRRNRCRLRVHALLVLARRRLPRPRPPLRPRPRPRHESRPRQQNQVRPSRRRGHRPTPSGRQLPPRLRLPQGETRPARPPPAPDCDSSANAPSCTATSTPPDDRPTCPPSPTTSSTSPNAAASRPTFKTPSSAAASKPTWPCSVPSIRPSAAWRPRSRTPRGNTTPSWPSCKPPPASGRSCR